MCFVCRSARERNGISARRDHDHGLASVALNLRQSAESARGGRRFCRHTRRSLQAVTSLAWSVDAKGVGNSISTQSAITSVWRTNRSDPNDGVPPMEALYIGIHAPVECSTTILDNAGDTS